ncbi:MAG: ATP-binding protein [Dehalococcoidales bacterium]|nr:ATP-binding protein [Dehalococcoidales bacterium]
MKNDKNELVLESTKDNLPVISDFVEETLSSFKADPAIVFKVQLAIDEACTNVINYAYGGNAGYMKIVLERADNDILITINDKGQPFDPTRAPSPDLTPDLEERKIGGLGIYFIKQIMDEVRYSYDNEEGNTLFLRKSLNSLKR